MTAHVIALIIGVALACFVIGTAYGVVCADAWRAAWWLLADRLRSLRGPAPVYVPVQEDEPEHPRFGKLLDTPPEGIEVTREDGMLRVRADLPAVRKVTEDHAPTGEFAAVPYAPPPPSWAAEPPTMEDLRRQYDEWKQPTYGETPVAGVLAAEAQAGAQPVDAGYLT